ncbi:hypothetical protein NIES21_32740 [Anabaenopsis circularis NIES-21]|uniref:Uncharacterized protein n=2 Tax=Nostocales TaxID=1161 RepID=A0A1Z4GJA8_9CYAN|nr:DUF892 family protein [Nostoc cycadae]BAY17436.1 hypothetical protein NIES21_32740 [Anabaenopsis circularis NIES-21]GBE90797.1 hypothetical protein NCWK1_0516 [Nostoc cycadae WK-1]
MVNLQERPSAITKITNLQEKLHYELCGMYDAESRFLEAQKMMVQCTTNKQLQSLIETHIRETEQQIRNLEQVFSAMGQQPKRINSDVAAAFVNEGQRCLLLTSDNPSLLDFTLAGALAKVENFEVISYQGLITGAEHIKQKEVVKLLQQNLQQEQQTAQKIEQHIPQLLQEAMSTTTSRK